MVKERKERRAVEPKCAFFFCFLHSGSVHISSLAEGFSAELKYDDLLGNSKKKSTYSNAIKISNKFQ